MEIRLFKPSLGEEELDSIRAAFERSWVGLGPMVNEFEKKWIEFVGCRDAVAVNSETAALHLALSAFDFKEGSKVLVPALTFASTATAILYNRLVPVFVDSDPLTLGISMEDLERKYDRNCVAVMPVHYAGHPVEMDVLVPWAREKGLKVIEDCAHSAVGVYKGKELGRWGDIGCFSFEEKKCMTTGDGGMLTTNNPKYDQKFRLWRQHGMSISDTVRHESKKVIFEEYPTTGFNYRMTDIQAAVGIEQLKRLPELIIERREIAEKYVNLFKEVPWLASPSEPPYARSNWQSYPVRLLEDAPLYRDELMQSLLDMGITTRRGIMNAHQEGAYKDAYYELQHSERASERVILLPLFSGSLNEIEKVVGAIRDVGAKYV